VTPFVLLLSAFGATLGHYAEQTDVLIGTAVGIRSRREMETIVGPLLNTAVVRLRPRAERTFAELVSETRHEVLCIQLNHEVPFEKVVEAVAPERTPGRSPLFQTMFVFQNIESPPLDLGDVRCEVQPHRSSTARFDLSVSMFEDAGGFSGQVEFDRDLFQRETVEHILRTFEDVVRRAALGPGTEIGALVVPGGEREEMLRRWEEGSVLSERDPRGESLGARVREWARRRPDAIAVSCGGQQLSYRTLWLAAARFADRLRRAGAKRDRPVCVAMPRCVELPVALLAICEAGAAFLPLEPGATAARLAAIWESAGCPIIVRRRADGQALPAGATTLALELGPEDTDRGGLVPAAHVEPERLAYMLHTSGSSGRPKLVMVPHAGIVNRLNWMQARYGLVPGERVLHKTPLAFDVAVWEIFWPLREGACLVVAAPDAERDTKLLGETLAREQIAVVHFVPSMLAAFLRQPGFAACAALREVVCSGEVLPARNARILRDQSTARLSNLYGPTEASIDVTAWECAADADDDPLPIGRPLDRVRCRILDDRLRRTAPGAPGHLHLSGPALARGYAGDPGRTALAFLPDPHAETPGERMYRTGDRARFRGDGEILFLGRADAELKVRGVRVDPTEVEDVLGEHPQVREVAVQLHPDSPGSLVAHVVPRGAAEALEPDALRALAGGRLPPQLVPSCFVLSTGLPRSSSGKVDRKSLPKPADWKPLGRPLPDGRHAPRSETEAWLVRSWRTHLPGSEIDLERGFFANGGHSLLALTLTDAINETFSIEMPLGDLLGSTSLRDVAQAIDALSWLSSVPDDSETESRTEWRRV
jgi:amino acid adenylation domain-containing protein